MVASRHAEDPWLDHAVWRQQRVAALTGPTGLLALVDRHLVGEESQAVAGTGVSVRRAAGRAGVWFTPMPDAVCDVDGSPLTGETFVPVARPGGTPLVGCAGRLLQVVAAGAGGIAVNVFDPAAPALAEFETVECYPYEPRLRITGVFEADDAAEDLVWPSTGGPDIALASAGVVTVTIDAVPYQMLVADDDGVPTLVFTDQTTAIPRPAPGRVLTLDPADTDGSVVLDFNRARLPARALSPLLAAPIPPPRNRIAAPIRAGERHVVWRGRSSGR